MARFLIVTADYFTYRLWLQENHPELADATYDDQMRIRAETLFGLADFYSSTLRELGHEAWDVVANSEQHQGRWAREHTVPVPRWTRDGAGWSLVRRARAAAGAKRDDWLLGVLAAQIRHYRPDVLLNQEMRRVPARFLRTLDSHFGVLVGQAEPVPLARDEMRRYDLVISSLQSEVDRFAESGVPAYVLRHAFHPRVLARLEPGEPIPLSFVGSLFPAHAERLRFLEVMAERHPELRLWSPAPPSSATLRDRYEGPAWGRDMYGVLARSRITLNHHLDALPYADNCRLYEATGVGTLLITDSKPNLPELFEPGKEVVEYRTVEECAELVGRYLAADADRARIAEAGQRRTLSEHTYRARVEELLELVARHAPQRVAAQGL